MSKPVLVSGIKPTGDLHIGNYFGAMRQMVELCNQGSHEAFIFIADYHALTGIQNAEEMRRRSFELAAAYMAVGLDAHKVTLFKQSEVPAHTELAWIFNTLTTMPYLMRAHAFKDAEAKNKEISVGTFTYPTLMASDILLYDATVVPVGQDQRQHVEITRDMADKFNHTFGVELFGRPEAYSMPEVAVVPGTDGQKMSKSYGNVVPLFGSRDELARRVMGIVTDSSAGRPTNVYALHTLVKTPDELEPVYQEYEGNYKMLKERLIEDLDRFLAPMRATYEELVANPTVVEEALIRGKQRAREVSEKKMQAVRTAIGVA